MDPETPLPSFDEKVLVISRKEAPEKLQESPTKMQRLMAQSVLNDFIARVKGQPQEPPSPRPKNKKQKIKFDTSILFMDATFSIDEYDRFFSFYKDDFIIILQPKVKLFHIIFSTRTRAFYFLHEGIYQRFMWAGFDAVLQQKKMQDILSQVQQPQE